MIDAQVAMPEWQVDNSLPTYRYQETAYDHTAYPTYDYPSYDYGYDQYAY